MVRQSWSLIDEIASGAGGLGVLKETFNLCGSLNSTYELKVFLARMYSFAAQYNGPYNFWIDSICYPIVESSSSSNPLEGVARALALMNQNNSCVHFNSVSGAAATYDILDSNSLKAWLWQQCSELVAIMGCNGDNSMLPKEVFDNATQYLEDCWYNYKAVPRLNWARTYYGGRDIKAGSNIIFSNGLMDPLSGFGILDDVSDTIVAIRTKQGSHCLDLNPARKDDPSWLVDQRQKEIRFFNKWITSGTSETLFPGKAPTTISVLVYFLVVAYLV